MMQSEYREEASARPVPAAEIKAVWPSLQRGLQVVKRKADPYLNLDSIRERLAASEAFLFLIPRGFFILRPIHRSTPVVLIWVAYARGGKAIEKHLSTINRLALDIGATHLEFRSSRPGYRRVFSDWQRDGQRYTWRLT